MPIIYKSEFTTGPDVTERQAKLFDADLEYAVSKGYEFIETSDHTVFQIFDKHNLVQIDVTEESLQAYFDSQAEAKQIFDELLKKEDTSEPATDYCVHTHNLNLIDQVINNSLRVETAITPQQADTMLKLARLKQMLSE